MIDLFLTKLTELENKVNNLESEINKLKEKQKKTKKRENNDRVTLEEAKQSFLDSPDNSDISLIFFAAQQYNKINLPKDLITSWAEVGKRTKKLKQLIQKFQELNPDENYCRERCKDWFEYLFTVIKVMKNDKGIEVPITYYVSVSPWAIQNWFTGFKSYLKIKQYRNLPELEEE